MQAMQLQHSNRMPPIRAEFPKKTGLVYAPILASALVVMATGGVQPTNTYALTSTVPKGKAAAHLVFSQDGVKIVKGLEADGDGPKWVEDLAWIRHSAEVTVSRLAEIFGVTRKAFYGWTEGAEPRKGGSLARISALREILSILPSDLHRTVLFNVADEPVGEDGLSLRFTIQRPVEDESYRERLNGKLAELSPAMDAALKRLGGSAPITAAFESDYPTV